MKGRAHFGLDFYLTVSLLIAVPVMTRYEYQVIGDPIQARGMDYGVNKINELGAEGWEIVGFRNNFVYLKRTLR